MDADKLDSMPIDDTPAGQARRWLMEVTASKKWLEKWHKQGRDIHKRFLDEREGSNSELETRWNLFSSNVQTQRAMLFGQVPKVSASRRFADAQDDLARVAGEMLERLLNTDIARDDDSYCEALGLALLDRLLPGAGNVRVRYVADFEPTEATPAKLDDEGKELAPEVPAGEQKTREDVEVDYVPWDDQLWSAGARVFGEVRWWAFKALMTRAQLEQRFGATGKLVPLNAGPKDRDGEKRADPWARAEVWEIWSKEDRKVYWWVDGFQQVLDEKEDPLELEGFWPFPRPMMANVTTSKLIPRPDYVLAQDLYNSVDNLSTRIKLLVDAVKAAGVYDATEAGLQQLLTKHGNFLLPVTQWARFTEKGGVKGAVDWMPLDQTVNAIGVLREQRQADMDALFQVTGMSDIMRGQATSGDVTATEQSIKAKFGSVRMQALQDEFARFASDVQKLKAQIIAKRFDTATILQRCNCANTPDAQMAPQAAEFIKSNLRDYRVEVKPEAVSLTDFAALKQERTEVIASISTFLQAAAPLAQQMPGAMPYLLQMLQWSVSGLRGASTIEGVLDQAITAAQNAPPTPPEGQQGDPSKIIAQQMKGEQDQAKIKAELEADIVRTQVEVQADKEREQNQMIFNVAENRSKQRDTAINRAMHPQPAPMAKPKGVPK